MTDDSAAIERAAGAAARMRGARLAVEEAERDLMDAVEAAREGGVTWAALAAATGLTEGQLTWRWHRDDPTYVEQAARQKEERAKAAAARVPKPRTGRGPGVSASEAARRLGVTRRTVYLRIEKGLLQSTENELGQTRVILEE